MNLPDVLDIIDDPEVGGGVPFQVRRVLNKRIMGDVKQTEEIFNATGNIQPSEKTSQASTPEDIKTERIVIYSTFEFIMGANNGAEFTGPDEILHNGNTYRLISVENWKEWGFMIAHAERVLG